MRTEISNPVVPSVPTMTSLEMVDFINSQRNEDEPELRHDNFMAKVPKVLGENDAPKFLGTQIYGNNNTRAIYNFPKREACLMAMSYSYELQAKVFDRMTELEQQATGPSLKSPAKNPHPSPVPQKALTPFLEWDIDQYAQEFGEKAYQRERERLRDFAMRYLRNGVEFKNIDAVLRYANVKVMPAGKKAFR